MNSNADFLDIPTHAALTASAASQAVGAPRPHHSQADAVSSALAQGGAQMQAILDDWLRGLAASLAQIIERSAQAAAALQQAWQRGDAHFASALWDIAVQWGGDTAVRGLLLLLLALLLAGWWLRRRGVRRAAITGVGRNLSSASRGIGAAAGASRVGGAAGALGVAAVGLGAAGLAAGAWADDDDHWLGAEAEPGKSFSRAVFDAADPTPASSGCAINPATGLPMIGDDCGGLDIAGNPYGVDSHTGDIAAVSTASASTADDAFSDIGGSGDDSFSWESSSSWDIGSPWDDGSCSSTSSWD